MTLRYKIALVATGTPCPRVDDPSKTQQYLQGHGFEVVYGEDCHSKTSAKKRAHIFLDYLLDPSIDMIWSIRGGEGSADLLPFIHQKRTEIKKIVPKQLMGYSDFTPFLIYFAQQYHWQTVHGPAALLLSHQKVSKNTEEKTLEFLLGQSERLIFDNLIPLNGLAKNSAPITTQLTGGNLSLAHSSLKDLWEINSDNKILMIEDVSEKTHVVSRMLKHFHRIGQFDRTSGLIFGDFLAKPIGNTLQAQEYQAASMQRLFKWFASDVNFPVYQTAQFGHGKELLPFVFNCDTQIKNSALTQILKTHITA